MTPISTATPALPASAEGGTALLAVATLAAIWAVRALRVLLLTLLIAKSLGWIAAVLGLALLLLFRGSVLVRIGAFLGALWLWHWPLIAALLLAAPRLFTMLPGAIATLLARIRHPRPLWSPLPAASSGAHTASTVAVAAADRRAS
jgi:hypothetical protein